MKVELVVKKYNGYVFEVVQVTLIGNKEIIDRIRVALEEDKELNTE